MSKDVIEVIRLPQAFRGDYVRGEVDNLTDLPNEMLINIISKLPAISRNNFVRSCKRVAKVADAHRLLSIDMAEMSNGRRREIMGDEIEFTMHDYNFLDFGVLLNRQKLAESRNAHRLKTIEPGLCLDFEWDGERIVLDHARKIFQEQGWQWNPTIISVVKDQILWRILWNEAINRCPFGGPWYQAILTSRLYDEQMEIENFHMVIPDGMEDALVKVDEMSRARQDPRTPSVSRPALNTPLGRNLALEDLIVFYNRRLTYLTELVRHFERQIE